jgi:glycosyltransferase involved in cell wall biosynthesis
MDNEIAGAVVAFNEIEVVLDRGGRFSVRLPAVAIRSDASFIIDIYDLDRPVHPEGHIGWWRFDLEQLPDNLAGRLVRDPDGGVRPEIEGAMPLDEWRNDSLRLATRMEILGVLRSKITNAILSVDRIPVACSERDLAEFRSGFDRDYRSPRYAPPHVLLPADSRIHIVATDVFQRDAVGELCLALYRMLRQHGVPVSLFADHFDLSMNDIIERRDALARHVGRGDIVLYFFSIYDPNLPHLAELSCRRKIAYFHGVTAPELLQVFDPELSAACRKAVAQIPLLASFDLVASNSLANAERLQAHLSAAPGRAAADIVVIPPKIVSEVEARTDDGLGPEIAMVASPLPSTTRFLHVGRIKSHKRIEDLLHLLAAYRRLDPEATCIVVGRADSQAYRDYLRWVQSEQLGLPDDAVRWLGNIPEQDLDQVYRGATVYVSMSEDEGFCLPLVEAMARNLLVVAYDLPAVRETLGSAGLVFCEKDFEHLSWQIHALLKSRDIHQAILTRQRERACELLREMDGRKLLQLLMG